MSTSAPSALSSYVFASRYSRHRDDLARYETRVEAIDRMLDMHREFYADKDISSELDFIRQAMLDGLVLGSQRALQFGGSAIIKKHARQYNCLDRKTQFITDAGVKSFEDFKHGDKVSVLTHEGNFVEATVRSYGEQPLYDIVIQRGNTEQIVRATRNHRWIKRDGTVTESLQAGDPLCQSPHVFQGFDYDASEPDERLWWCYGFVYGDGTCVKTGGRYTHSMVRLCGEKRAFLHRFTEMGFKHSFPPSCDDDPMVYTGHYLKTTPDLDKTDVRLIRAFVAGYLDADGARNNIRDGISKFVSIQVTGEDECDFVRRAFPTAGVYIVSESDKTGEETNYGKRPYTILFRINQGTGKTAAAWRVQSISDKPTSTEEVWCLDVPGPHSFVLPTGLVTGNCYGTHCDRPRMFAEAFWLLLCGGGVGFSVQRHHINRLPPIKMPGAHSVSYVVPDTIEGWADALNTLLASYGMIDAEMTAFADYVGKRVHFDYSLIRPKGAPLSTSSGRAPGPVPLRNALEKIRALLNRIIGNRGDAVALQPINAYDIIMHAADAVISGGVRRSATLCLFSADDQDMINAKSGNWFHENPQRGRSNNSALLIRDAISFDTFKRFFDATRQFGEPGFIWADSTEIILNPCAEVQMWPIYEGRTGWSACNLSEVNARACNHSAEKWLRAVTAASMLGTLQAGYTTFDYLGPTSEAIIRRDALLGVSMTGMMDNPSYSFHWDFQREIAKKVLDVNEALAVKLGINPAARATCIKPAGSSSCLLDTASGIHAHHARRYLRRAQANEIEEALRLYRAANPRAVELSVWNPNGTDHVITFCVEIDDEAITKHDISALQQLERVKCTQENWVKAGARPDRCVGPVMHAVSNTVNVRDSEWDSVADYIYTHRAAFAGVSLLSHEGDLDYPQAPFCAVKTEEELVKTYASGVFLASGLIVDGLAAFNDNLWGACDAALGRGAALETPTPPADAPPRAVVAYHEVHQQRVEWVRRLHQFADRYFNNDLRKATHCLKDVHNFKLWLDLRREYQPVDYTMMMPIERVIAPDAACAGGACDTAYA
jgi:ribonucleoside-diphosphate reductase alpha chain